jgi:hypothetical protein
MAILGLYSKDVGALEGGDDPGRVFIKRENVRALVCALSLLNLKGCSDEGSMDHGWNLFIFTAVLGLVMIFPSCSHCLVGLELRWRLTQP